MIIAHYKLNDNAATDTIIDNTGSHNGAIKDAGGTATSAFHSAANSRGVGTCLDFDGTDDYVSTDKSLLNNLSEFTLACWVNAINYTSNQIGIVGQNDLVEFGFNNDGNVVCWITGGVGNHTIAYPYTYPSWHHVAAVCTEAGTILYIDGQKAFGPGTAPSDNYGSSTYPVNIGGGGIWDASGNWFQGQIDDVRIYNRALSGAEAAWLGGVIKPFDKPF